MSDPVRAFGVESARLVPLDVPPDATDVNDLLDLYPDGVYTAMRTFDGRKFVAVEAHFDRTERSMVLAGWAGATERLDRVALRRGMQSIADAEEGDHVMRIDVLPPGSTLPGTTSTTLLTVTPYRPVPDVFRREGVSLGITSELTRATPRIKTSEFATRRRPYPLGTREAFDHLLIDDDGHVLEGTSCNFYLVSGARLRTSGEGVLLGVTQGLVLELARSLGLDVRLDPVQRTELTTAEEAFLTSSTRGIVPVVGVAGSSIGSGNPGVWTKRLADALAATIETDARPAWPV